jgi:hypothetical protein
VQTTNIKRPSSELWQKEYGRLVPFARLTLIAHRTLIFGLLASIIGIVLCHFARLPQSSLRWAAIVFIAAAAAVEIIWKCFSAHYLDSARAGWMKTRSGLVDFCGEIATLADQLRAGSKDATGSCLRPVREKAALLSGHVQTILASLEEVDESVEQLEQQVPSGLHLALGGLGTLASLPKIWERFSFVLPAKVRREAFDPAFNDMLEDYMRVQKSVGKSARRWVSVAFTVCAVFIVVDCLRVMMTRGAGRLLLGFVPESIRVWWRRH